MPLELKNIKGGGLHYVRYFPTHIQRLQKHRNSNLQRWSQTLHQTPRKTHHWTKGKAK